MTKTSIMNTHTFYSKDLFDVCVSCDVLHCVCFIQVLCFFDNCFALLHVLTNQSRYKYVSLYWVHSASYLTLMNKVLLEEVDSRSYPYPRKKSHNTGADIQIDFSSHNYSPDFILLWYPPLFSSWNSFIKTFVAGQPLMVIAF